MSGGRANPELMKLLAEILDRSTVALERQICDRSFIEIGGSSLDALRFVALAGSRTGRAVDAGLLLSACPVSDVIHAAGDVVDPLQESLSALPVDRDADREALPAQVRMLLASDSGSRPYHLLFSAEITGDLDMAVMSAALNVMTARHEALRTVFLRTGGEYRRRVLSRYSPHLHRIALSEGNPALGTDGGAARAAHALIAPSSHRLLLPERRPPVEFFLSVAAGQPIRHVLSMLVHHALMDAYAVGLFWRELAEAYDLIRLGHAPDARPAPSPDRVLDRHWALVRRGEFTRLAQQRAVALTDVPPAAELPSDLTPPRERDTEGTRYVFTLSSAARESCDALRQACAVTRPSVLLTAWALVVARRSRKLDLTVAVPSCSRPDEELMRAVAPCARLLPVRCVLDDGAPVKRNIQAVSASLVAAVTAGDLPPDELAATVSSESAPGPSLLATIGFSAHDDLIPDRLSIGRTEWVVHEGHCGGSTMDATLYLQRWGERPRLAIEYGTAALTPSEASDLAQAVEWALVEMARHRDAPLGQVRTAPPSAHHGLTWGPAADVTPGIWNLFVAVAERQPDEPAVLDGACRLTYGQLAAAAESQAARLARSGVGRGSLVVVAHPPSAAEIVSVLGVLRAGAAYLALDLASPDQRLRDILHRAQPAAMLAPDEVTSRLARLADGHLPLVPSVDPAAPDRSYAPLAPVPASGEDIAYVAFTSGSTGGPKGVRIPHRAVVRLVHDSHFVRTGPGERFLRFAPLAFDASTLEIFAPLASGATVVVYPGAIAAPGELADFLREHGVTVAWLTAGMFRIMVDHSPYGFETIRQVLTGGDLVPPEHVQRLLRYQPGLRVTNGYGPTENTTFTTVHHVDDDCEVDDPLPIGLPVPGTGVAVLDSSGRIVPRGGIGELHVAGDGLALGYLQAPDATARAFGHAMPGTGEALYATGDLVRWDGRGRLRFLGREDDQIKIRGFRIEIDEVRECLAGHADVRDAVVVTLGEEASTRRLGALVAADGSEGLVERLRAYAAERLPPSAVPALWAVVDQIPVTRNGKVDRRAAAGLVRDAADRPAADQPSQEAPPVSAAALTQATAPAGPASRADTERTILAIWQDVLGRSGLQTTDRFFEVGGDSLRLIELAERLRGTVGPVSMVDLFRHLTIESLAEYLCGRAASPAPDANSRSERLRTLSARLSQNAAARGEEDGPRGGI